MLAMDATATRRRRALSSSTSSGSNSSPERPSSPRVTDDTSEARGGNAGPEPKSTSGPDDDVPLTLEWICDLVSRAEEGDESTVPQIRKFIEKDPELVTRYLGADMADLAERSMVRRVAGKNVGYREAAPRKLALLRDELAGPNPTPIERLLVERAVLCWFAVNDYETRYAQNADDIALGQSEYLQRQIDRGHKRYLSALRTLAAVQKLAVPGIQVNIARKQVNVAGST
jgi:hypothetical protein